MPTDHIRYDLLAQEALRGLVRKVLIDVARDGLPGDHHFYIKFDTRAQGVRISQRLRERFPEEMTIVLQHQFWDLAVTEHTFEVGLSFSGVPERLLVPFGALKGFFDPSVNFGLEFEVLATPAEPRLPAPQPSPAMRLATEKPSTRPPRGAGSEPSAVEPPTAIEPRRPSVPKAGKPQLARAEETPSPPDDDKPTPPAGGAEVVSLDRFRKK
jgi:hypothetical protein